MDNKKLILAVAGSGKTFYLVQQLNEQGRFLLLTYTISGTENLISEIIKRFGYLPNNVKVYNYFSFLYSFCYKPYLSSELNEKGIYWKYSTNFYNQSYLTKSRYLYHNKLSKLVSEKIIEQVCNRIEKYFDYLLIDEIQDFAGNDFNFLINIMKSKLDVLLVGDFYQHTFDTSRDRQTNKSLHYDHDTYVSRYKKAGITIDKSSLINSKRCSKTICIFLKQKLGIEIESEYNNITECKLITDENEIKSIYSDNNIIKLFYKEHYNHKCKSDNWGNCKGLTYENVCVIVNDEIYTQINTDKLIIFKAQTTKNKFYVACSRAKNNLYFIYDKHIKLIT